jgi:hypothetical protein
MTIDNSALLCILITVQMMRDVKTRDVVPIDAHGGYPNEGFTVGVGSLIALKRNIGPIRNVEPSQGEPFVENSGGNMVVSIFVFSAGSYTSMVLHRALTVLGRNSRYLSSQEIVSGK